MKNRRTKFIRSFRSSAKSVLAVLMILSFLLSLMLTACTDEVGTGTDRITDPDGDRSVDASIAEEPEPDEVTTGVEAATSGSEDTAYTPDDTTENLPDDTTDDAIETTAPPETSETVDPIVTEGELYYNEAFFLIGKGKFMQATKFIAKIAQSDAENRAKAESLIEANSAEFSAAITEAVTEYMVRYRISEGEEYLNSLLGLSLDSHIRSEKERLEAYRVFQDVELETVSLSQTLENIYTHCLIAFPEINFRSKSTYRNCGDDCLTPDEFRYLLDRLYGLGYIIIDANLLYDEENDSPNYTLELPKGKKPLVFTFDDVTYDSRKMGLGMVDKIIVDEDGYVCSYTKHKNGAVVVSYDNEIFPIINSFVREHPDFTYRGARGTLFFTGFDGILGYRTQSEPIDDAEAALGLDRNEEIKKAAAVIEALRMEGWTFGSHSYDHAHMTRLSPEAFKADADKWLEEVGSIIGETKLFCWPYGDHTDANYDSNLRKGELHKYLYDSGFKVFFGCGAGRYLANELDGLGIFTDRKGMTGNVLYYIDKGYQAYLTNYLYLIDPDDMWDEYRLPYRYIR